MRDKSLVVIQGEGRGHLNQFKVYIKDNIGMFGDSPDIVISNQRKNDIDFYIEEIEDILPNSNIYILDSLNISYSNGKMNILKTITNSFKKIPNFLNSLWVVYSLIKHNNYRYVINFYEILYLPSILFSSKKISVANQFLFKHPGWLVPQKNMEYYLLQLWNKLLTINSDLIVSPSFIAYKHINNNFKIIEPLIDKELLSKYKTDQEDFILIYCINEDTLKDKIAPYININKDLNFKIYCDKNFKIDNITNKNVSIHNLNRDKFLTDLAKCSKIISNGGFQLISEALFYNKQIEIIPIQYEQEINVYNLEVHNIGKLFSFVNH